MNVIINIQNKTCNMKFSTFHPAPDTGGKNSTHKLYNVYELRRVVIVKVNAIYKLHMVISLNHSFKAVSFQIEW